MLGELQSHAAIAAHLVDEFYEIALRFVLRSSIRLAQVQILEHFLIFLNREDHRGLVTAAINDVLNVCHGGILA